jgi:hypothetical protein
MKMESAPKRTPTREISHEEFNIYKISKEFWYLYEVDTEHLIVVCIEEGIKYTSEYSEKTRKEFVKDAQQIIDDVKNTLVCEFGEKLSGEMNIS